MTNHPTWHYLEHLVAMLPSWFLAVGGATTLVLSHLESGLNRTAASLAALAMIATVSYRALVLIRKWGRRSDSIDEVIQTVPKLVEDVAGLHEGQLEIKAAHAKDAAALHRGQEDIKAALRAIQDRARQRRAEDPLIVDEGDQL